jgi:rubredoxin-NAD+ reductase
MAPLIIIGAGLAGWTTVREFRKLDTTTPVVVITRDSGDFYAKPSLSNAFAQKRTPEQLVNTPAAKMAETLQVTLLAHTQVDAINLATQTLHTTQGDVVQTLDYSRLVLATGAQPIRVPVQGNASGRVQSVNSLDDFFSFFYGLSPRGTCADSYQIESKHIIIMGAGLIGCEFANDLAQAGHRVQVVDPSTRPLAALLPEPAGLQLQEALGTLGVVWHFGATVQAVDTREPADTADTDLPALTVQLSNGQTLPADAVLSAIGLRADTALASAAGLACERGIVVDAYLQTSAPQVYALGDGAQYASAGQRPLPYVMPIMQAAKALAATLAGTPTPLVFPLMPVAIKTPALPIVVAAAHPAQAGSWVADDEASHGLWRFLDPQGVQRGFVLTGTQTTRRMEQARATSL